MLKKRIESFGYAFQGIRRLFKNEPNAKIHLLATILVVAGGFYFHLSASEWCISILAIASVLAAEAFNSAIEDLTDLVSPDHHPLAGHAKDLAAGAVLITAIGAAIIGFIVFFPKVKQLFF